MTRRQVGERGRQQTRKRVDAGRKLIDDQIKTLRKSTDELLDVAPVKSVVGLVAGTIDNLASFVKKQAELTRARVR